MLAAADAITKPASPALPSSCLPPVAASLWTAITRIEHLAAASMHRLEFRLTIGALHFCDSGLACHLLGIRDAEQLVSHPLRGALFESWVASEILKWRLHRGLPADLHHYRETRGAEIDLLLPIGEAGVAIECKAGRTVQPSFLHHLHRFDAPGWKRCLVYGGDTRQMRSHCTVLPWHELPDLDWR